MISDQPYRVSGGKLALGVFLALALGVLTPVLTALEISLLMPVAVLGGVFTAFLYVYAGRLPAWLFTAIHLASASVLLGTDFMWMLMAAGCIPGLVAVRGIMARRPFFEQLKVNVAIFGLGMVIALCIAWGRFGGGMIGRAVDALLQQFDRMPDAFFEPFVEAVNRAITTSGIIGLKALTVSAYREKLAGIMALARQTYEEALPGALLSGAALSGVLTTMWCSWLLARRGFATNDSYAQLNRWFLPAGATGGLMLIWIISYVMTQTGYASGESVYVAAYDLVNLAFFFQALAAADRFFFRRGVPDASRRRRLILLALTGAVIPIMGLAMFVIGAGSAMFGSRGAIRTLFKRDDDHTI